MKLNADYKFYITEILNVIKLSVGSKQFIRERTLFKKYILFRPRSSRDEHIFNYYVISTNTYINKL